MLFRVVKSDLKGKSYISFCPVAEYIFGVFSITRTLCGPKCWETVCITALYSFIIHFVFVLCKTSSHCGLKEPKLAKIG